MNRLCTIGTNLRDLPTGAFKVVWRPTGKFHQATFDLVLIFGLVAGLELVYDNQMIPSRKEYPEVNTAS